MNIGIISYSYVNGDKKKKNCNSFQLFSEKRINNFIFYFYLFILITLLVDTLLLLLLYKDNDINRYKSIINQETNPIYCARKLVDIA